MVHMYDGGNPLRRANPQHWNRCWIRNGIAIQREDLKGMARQRQAADLRSASVQDMKQDSFPLLHPDRLSMPEHASVDRKGSVAHFVPVRDPAALLEAKQRHGKLAIVHGGRHDS